MKPVVVGAGRVGQVLRAAAPEALLVTRDGPWDFEGVPIAVCTRNDDLDVVLPKLSGKDGLVLLQNGILDTVLERHGLQDATLGVLYFAAAARDGVAVPGGTSWFCGPQAAAMVAWLGRGGLSAQALPLSEFRKEVAIKMAWNCTFGLLGEATRAPVGTLLTTERGAIRTLSAELSLVLGWGLNVVLDADEVEARLLAYSAKIPDYPARLKEWPWRNGWVETMASRLEVAIPTHQAWVDRCRAMGWAPA